MTNNKSAKKEGKKVEDNPNKASNNSWGNVFDSDLTDDVKQNINKFIKSANNTINSTTYGNIDNGNLARKMIKNLTDNFNDTFERNVALSQDCLKCRTATDFIDIQRKFFEHNFKSITKTYTDLLHDIQQISNHSIKNSSECLEKNNKCFNS
ncbi:MAG: hypothetical protein Tsb006_6130 [Rickettsiaceae bacterium]